MRNPLVPGLGWVQHLANVRAHVGTQASFATGRAGGVDYLRDYNEMVYE
jgi:hypothetical protein